MFDFGSVKDLLTLPQQNVRFLLQNIDINLIIPGSLRFFDKVLDNNLDSLASKKPLFNF